MSRIKKHKYHKQVEYAEKKQKKISKSMLMTIIIAGLMILSVFGIMFWGYDNGTEENQYNKFSFQRTETQWALRINKQLLLFDYHPSQVEDIDISPAIIAKIQNAPMIYITFDPDAKNIQKIDYSRFKLSEQLATKLNIYALSSVSENTSLYQLPVINCSNASASIPVIYLKESNVTKVTDDNNCLIFESESQTTIALSDRLLFGLFGIIK